MAKIEVAYAAHGTNRTDTYTHPKTTYKVHEGALAVDTPKTTTLYAPGTWQRLFLTIEEES